MKLLLIDDEEQAEIIEAAKDMGIEVLHDKDRSVDASLLLLKQQYWQIDGVILDARLDPAEKFQKLNRCLNYISELNGMFHWWKPTCVWTGHPRDVKDNLDTEVPLFSKHEGDEPVLKYLKGIIQDLPAYQVKQKYREDLDACREAKLDDATSPSAGPKRSNADPDACRKVKLDDDTLGHIEEILRNLHGNSAPLEEDYPKHLRTALEWMFRKAICLCLVHDTCLRGSKVNIENSRRFMSGELVHMGERSIHCSKPHFPPMVRHHVEHILKATNPYSHTDDPAQKADPLHVREFAQEVSSPNLLYSLTFQLLDVLRWFKKYADAHSNLEENKKLWVDTSPIAFQEEVEGTIIKQDENDFAFLKWKPGEKNAHITSELVRNHDLKDGSRIAACLINEEHKGKPSWKVTSIIRIIS